MGKKMKKLRLQEKFLRGLLQDRRTAGEKLAEMDAGEFNTAVREFASSAGIGQSSWSASGPMTLEQYAASYLGKGRE